MWTPDEVAFATFIVTCAYAFFTLAYVVLVAFTLGYIHKQLEQQKKEHRLQETLTILKELQTQELFNQRRYIYENLPETIEGVDGNQLKAHMRKVDLAIVAFNRIGYLMDKGYVDTESILENHWSVVWRCWQKSKNLIKWEREIRNEPKHFEEFEYLFNLSEEYRLQNGYEEPKIYGASRIIT